MKKRHKKLKNPPNWNPDFFHLNQTFMAVASMLIFPGVAVAFTFLKNYGGKFQEFSLILVGLMPTCIPWFVGHWLPSWGASHTEIFYMATYFDIKSWRNDIPSVPSVDILRHSKQPITKKNTKKKNGESTTRHINPLRFPIVSGTRVRWLFATCRVLSHQISIRSSLHVQQLWFTSSFDRLEMPCIFAPNLPELTCTCRHPGLIRVTTNPPLSYGKWLGEPHLTLDVDMCSGGISA